MFPNSGFVLGTFAGIQIRLHWTFLLAAGWFFQNGFDGLSLLLFVTLFGSVLLHELGHCFAARSVGGRADVIVLWPLGGVAYTQANRGNVLHSVWISLSGPLVNFLIGAACALALWARGYVFHWVDFSPLEFAASGGLSEIGAVLFMIFKMQLLLFCLNVLLPAYPLDGGQALASLLSLVVPLNTCILIMTATTVGAAVFLVSQDETFLAVYLAMQLPALLRPASDFHPLAHFYNRPGVIEGRSPIFVAQGLELRPCPKCQEKLHPESELCPHCGEKYPFA